MAVEQRSDMFRPSPSSMWRCSSCKQKGEVKSSRGSTTVGSLPGREKPEAGQPVPAGDCGMLSEAWVLSPTLRGLDTDKQGLNHCPAGLRVHRSQKGRR